MTDRHDDTGLPRPADPDVRRRHAVRVVHAFYTALEAKDLDAFAELWTADAVYRVPVTPYGVPGEFAGRDAIVAGLRQFFALFGKTRFTWDAEPMGDPRRVLATWTLEIELLGGGTYRNRGASIFRLEHDRIAEFTEYVDTAAFLGLFSATIGTAHRFFELLNAKDLDAWGELWHGQGTITVPYSPQGSPSTIEGKDEIVAAYRELFAAYETFGTELTGVHPAVGSDAVCVQYRIRATLAGGAEYTNDAIAVLRFRDGLISAFHDYVDPRRFQDVLDTLR
ncbi:nuclear transport factor 2 family protein [Streptomyces sp. NBC_00080]|uniref:nuclear transport factor 2 family protein n=1 Tax=unclassified Streptomyces TaxID=2593676 RepID=UPI00114E0313|nr:nuclear transport factor 2 family protein [Streptomyces sp. SLBN-115]TQJ37127.1 ketosteroid isomerase-like protein [Streptomyces sp. SLBN-115]